MSPLEAIIPISVTLFVNILLGALILTPIIMHYRAKTAARRLVGDILTSGHPVDAEVLERLIPPSTPADPRGIAFWFSVPGVILCFIGVGLAAAGIFFAPDRYVTAGQLTGATIVGSMGVGFLLISVIAYILFKTRPKA